MNIHLNSDDFFNHLYSTLSNREFETYIFALVELQLKKSKKKLHRFVREQTILKDGKKSFIEFDGVSLQGIDDLSGPTIIEFKRRLTPSIMDFIFQAIRFAPKYKSILVIIGSVISVDDRAYIEDVAKSSSKDFQIKVWDLNKIVSITKEFPEETLEIIQNLGEEVLKSTVEIASNIKDWRDDRIPLLNNLNQSFKNDDVVLFLGAGVSKDAGLPTWDELLRSLNISIIESKVPFKISNIQKEEILKLLTELQAGTPLVTASYIRKALDTKFLDVIRDSLYNEVKPLDKQLQLATIAKASRPLIGKLGIRALITYNFDDLLEQHLEALGIDFKSIYREGDFEIATKRPIYHVHGFVPSKPEKYPELDKSILVFAEDGYHSLQNDPYSWSNLVQLKALRESTCVLIGLSGIDPNLRRLFSNFSKRFDGCKHYILLQRQLKSTNTSLTQNQFDKFSNLHHSLQEDVFRELGLKVIWYESHTEIPNLVNQITEL